MVSILDLSRIMMILTGHKTVYNPALSNLVTQKYFICSDFYVVLFFRHK